MATQERTRTAHDSSKEAAHEEDATDAVGQKKERVRAKIAKALQSIRELRFDGKPAVSLESIEEWNDRLHAMDPNEAEAFILNRLPKLIDNWRVIALERRDLLKDDRYNALKESDLISDSDLKAFASGKDFLNAHYERRVQLVQKIKEALPRAKHKHQKQRDAILQEIRAKLEACARDKYSILSHKDIGSIMEAWSEKGLKFAETEKKKTQWVQEGLTDVVPRYLKEATLYGAKVMSMLHGAVSEKAISEKNFNEWIARMKNGSWEGTKEFIEKKFSKYVENWKHVASQRRELLKHPQFKTLKNSKMMKPEELAIFLSDKAFLDAHYKQRVNLVDLVKAAFARLKEGPSMEKLKVMARAKLDQAVREGILAQNKVGTWMKRIFSEENSMETIQNFLHGKGAFPFSTLRENWVKVKGRFDHLQKLRKEKGTPRSFHFVSTEVFLGWEFEKREAYVEEAEHRFEDIEKEPGIFLKIRHELDTKDWEAAEELITQAKTMPWFDDDRKKLQSMERFLKEHRRSGAEEGEKQEKPGPDEILGDMREALEMIPSDSIRKRFLIAMENYDYQTLWALCTMYYNWDWCRVHGYSSEEIDANFRSTAKAETYAAEEQGTSRGHVNYDATTNTSVTVFRDENDTRSAQAIHVDETTDNGQLIHKINLNKDNRAVWYWTRIMEKNVPFEQVRYMIYNIQPRLKKGMRQLQGMGYRFTRTGPAQKKDGGTVEPRKETPAASPGVEFAMKA